MWSTTKSRSTRDRGWTAIRRDVDFKPGQVLPVVIDGRQLGAIAVNDILP